jgi:hypothetical protein
MRKQLHPTCDFDDAFLAFTLRNAGGRHPHTGVFSGAENRHASRNIDPVSIDREGDRHE